jgi:Tfp pilus assembly protein PilF
MKHWAILLLSLAIAGCASTSPRYDHSETLFQDALFAAPSERISADDVFALSDEMRHYLKTEIADQLRARGPQRALIEALYAKDQLKLDYDSELTRNAAQTFKARAGNCLSLAIMTAAMAKSLGLVVRYQQVLVDDSWSRSGGMYFSSMHVNITLGTQAAIRTMDSQSTPMTIDFLPGADLQGRRFRVLEEDTIVAMYMNNRAAEALARGNVNDAYWWARDAIEQDRQFTSAYNTLGVIYRHHGDLQASERVLNRVLKVEPGNTQVMANLALVLRDQGRVAEAAELTRRVAELEPYPPFHFFRLGMAAMQKRDFAAARDYFKREVDRDSNYHEFQFWLAAAYMGLGETREARKHLSIALENSTTRKEHELYAAKLDKINSFSVH